MTEIEREYPAPPVGEEVHLPGPTLLPFMCALGITLIVIGTTVFFPIPMIVGGILFLVTVAMWISDTRRDMAELPPEHHAP
jgi:hypothetical protein